MLPLKQKEVHATLCISLPHILLFALSLYLPAALYAQTVYHSYCLPKVGLVAGAYVYVEVPIRVRVRQELTCMSRSRAV